MPDMGKNMGDGKIAPLGDGKGKVQIPDSQIIKPPELIQKKKEISPEQLPYNPMLKKQAPFILGR